MNNNNLKIVIKIIVVIVILINLPLQKVYSEKIESVVSTLTSFSSEESNGKSVYIYNTHQSEEYSSKSVKEGSKYLMDLLEGKGYTVKYETEDFELYKVKNNMPYNQSYAVSKKYILSETKKNKYDLIIDFHRDSINKNLSTLTYDNKSYAKMMFVVGKGSPNYENVKKISQKLSSMTNEKIPKLSRGIYVKQSHYNQGLANNMVLIEVGAHKNTYQEVTNTLNILSLVIDEYLSQ